VQKVVTRDTIHLFDIVVGGVLGDRVHITRGIGNSISSGQKQTGITVKGSTKSVLTMDKDKRHQKVSLEKEGVWNDFHLGGKGRLIPLDGTEGSGLNKDGEVRQTNKAELEKKNFGFE